MGKPREEVQEKSYYQDIYFLYEILNSLRDVEEAKLVINDLLTKSELRMLKRRWHLANLLWEGLDIRTAAEKAKTSTTTVSKVKQILDEGTGGLKLALTRMQKTLREERNRDADKVQNLLKSGFKLVATCFNVLIRCNRTCLGKL